MAVSQPPPSPANLTHPHVCTRRGARARARRVPCLATPGPAHRHDIAAALNGTEFFSKEAGAGCGGNRIGKCGAFKTRDALEKACLADQNCGAYSTWEKGGPWCMKSKYEAGTMNEGHDCYVKTKQGLCPRKPRPPLSTVWPLRTPSDVHGRTHA